MKENLKTNRSAYGNGHATDQPRPKEQSPGKLYDGTKIYVPGQLKSDYSGYTVR